MKPSTLADDLMFTAQCLRACCEVIHLTGEPIEVPWPNGSGVKSLHQLTIDDILADAEAFETDAAKLRSLYS